MADLANQSFAVAASASLRSVDMVHARALSVLNECLSEQDKIYAVASAGAVWCQRERSTELRLFTVIEDFAADTELLHALGELVNELAQAAGSTHVKGAGHG